MPAGFHLAVVERARELYTQDFLSPDEIVHRLEQEVADRQLIIPGPDARDPRVPAHRSTINNWAKKFGWTHWREAKDKRSGSSEPFSISGITDPIYHLARVMALNHVREECKRHPRASVGEILASTMLHLGHEIDPGKSVYRALAPEIRRHIRQYRKEIAKLTKEGTEEARRKTDAR